MAKYKSKMIRHVEQSSARQALIDWQYAKRQYSPKGLGGPAFQKGIQKLLNATTARLTELWEQHEIGVDEFGEISLYLAKYDPKELQALLEWHNSK